MEKLTKPALRVIIDDFATDIGLQRSDCTAPSQWTINFRNELRNSYARGVYWVPIELLRYRKNNGRIISDVISYEKNYNILDEVSSEAQKVLRGFLERKDPEKTEKLKKLIQHEGQSEPAIITCDGFLINGNRRKVVFEKLLDQYPGREDFKRMKVVILPDKNDKKEGGPPTLVEIEELENRYQLREEGKAEYSGLDKALAMRRKIEMGISLEQLLRDDPNYAGFAPKEFKISVEKVKSEFMVPLMCVDRYLHHLGREELYNTVAARIGDPEGRWQAFIDYAAFYQKLYNEKKRVKLRISEDEIGDIEDVAFKIVRMRELPGLPKVHQIMRNLNKWLPNKDSKKELLKIVNIDLNLPREDMVDASGKEKEHLEIDKIWRAKHQGKLTGHVRKASDYYDYSKVKETPVKLLDDVLKKLCHENMEPKDVAISELKRAMKLAEAIVKRADELKSEFYQLQKNLDKFHPK